MDEYKDPRESIKNRILFWLEDIWPTIYRWINDFLDGLVNFFKDLITGLWR